MPTFSYFYDRRFDLYIMNLKAQSRALKLYLGAGFVKITLKQGQIWYDFVWKFVFLHGDYRI